MVRLGASVALVVLLIAGCSDPSTPDSPTAPTQTVATSTAPPPPIIRTDDLHLVEAPHLVGTLHTSPVEVRTPIVKTGLNEVAMSAEWSLPAPEMTDLRATLHVFIDIQGVVSAASTKPTLCFLGVAMAIEHADGTRDTLTSYCRGSYAVAPMGVQEHVFDVPQTLDALPVPGDRLVFHVEIIGTFAPGATAEVVSGTPETDSKLTIQGLQIPIDTETYL